VSRYLTAAALIGQVFAVVVLDADIVIIAPMTTIELICQLSLRPEPAKED
jgi:hypothetical protein